jgi:hypothetical protein
MSAALRTSASLFAAQRPELGAFTPEFLRIRGELLLLRTTPAAAKPSEEFFMQALDLAHRHGALSLELRAATSLALLLRDQGHRLPAADLRALYGGV